MTCVLNSTDDDLLHSPFDEIIEVTLTLGPSEVVEIDPVDRRGITYNYVLILIFQSDITAHCLQHQYLHQDYDIMEIIVKSSKWSLQFHWNALFKVPLNQ